MWGLPEGVGGAGWRGTKREKLGQLQAFQPSYHRDERRRRERARIGNLFEKIM